MNAPYRQQDLDAARHLIEKPMLLSSEARYALQLAVAEIDRCHARIDELLAANNREVERRRAAELAAHMIGSISGHPGYAPELEVR